MSLLNLENTKSDYLFVAIALNHEVKNFQQPSPVIPEHLQLSDS